MVSSDPVVTTRPNTTTGDMTHPLTMNSSSPSWPNKSNQPTAANTTTATPAPNFSSDFIQSTGGVDAEISMLMGPRAGAALSTHSHSNAMSSASLSRLPTCSSILNGVLGGAVPHSETMLSPRPALTQQHQQQPRPRQPQYQHQQHSASAAAAAVAAQSAMSHGVPNLLKPDGGSNSSNNSNSSHVPEVPQAFTIAEQDYSHRMRTLSNMSFPDFFHRNRTLSNNSLSGFDFFPRDRSLSNNSLVLPNEYASVHQQQHKPTSDAHFEVLRDFLSPPPSALTQQQQQQLHSMENTQQANYINNNLQYQYQQQQQQHQQYMQQQQHQHQSYGARAAAAAAAAAAGSGIGSYATQPNRQLGHIDLDAQPPPYKKVKTSSTSDAAAALTGLQYGSGSSASAIIARRAQPRHSSGAAAVAAVGISSENAAAAGSLLGIGSRKFAVPKSNGSIGSSKAVGSSKAKASSASTTSTSSSTTSSFSSSSSSSSLSSSSTSAQISSLSSTSASSSIKAPKNKIKRISMSNSAQIKALKASIPADLPVTSKFRGVCWYRRTGKWVCQIKVNGMRRHVGYFACEYEAAKAYDKALFEMIEMAVRNPNGSKRPGVSRKRVFNPEKRKPNLTEASAADSKAADVAKANKEASSSNASKASDSTDGAKEKKAHDATVKQLLKLQQRLAEDFKRQSAAK